MNPNCTAFVRKPMPETPMLHALIRSGAALFALNQSDVPNNCAIAIVATGCDRGNGAELVCSTWLLMAFDCNRCRDRVYNTLSAVPRQLRTPPSPLQPSRAPASLQSPRPAP